MLHTWTLLDQGLRIDPPIDADPVAVRTRRQCHHQCPPVGHRWFSRVTAVPSGRAKNVWSPPLPRLNHLVSRHLELWFLDHRRLQ